MVVPKNMVHRNIIFKNLITNPGTSISIKMKKTSKVHINTAFTISNIGNESSRHSQ